MDCFVSTFKTDYVLCLFLTWFFNVLWLHGIFFTCRVLESLYINQLNTEADRKRSLLCSYHTCRLLSSIWLVDAGFRIQVRWTLVLFMFLSRNMLFFSIALINLFLHKHQACQGTENTVIIIVARPHEVHSIDIQKKPTVHEHLHRSVPLMFLARRILTVRL